MSSLVFITHFSVHGPSIIAEQTIHTKEAMDDETFDAMMPVKKLGGKYSGPPSDTVNSNEKVTSWMAGQRAAAGSRLQLARSPKQLTGGGSKQLLAGGSSTSRQEAAGSPSKALPTYAGRQLAAAKRKSYVQKCDKCEFKCSSKIEMNSHMVKGHKKTTFECNDCSYYADTMNDLKNHISKKHTVQDEKYSCEMCNYKSRNKKKLEIHKEGKHGGGRINTGAGFMMVFNPVPDDSPTVPQEEVLVENTIENKKQHERKTRVETLSKPVKVKKLKTKANLESWRNKYATIKKKFMIFRKSMVAVVTFSSWSRTMSSPKTHLMHTRLKSTWCSRRGLLENSFSVVL